MSSVSPERATDLAQPDSKEPPAEEQIAEMEGDIREFVRKDLASLRRLPESGSEMFVNNLNSIVQRVAGSSVAEIDNLIEQLERLREHLHNEGQRVQREVTAYAQMSHAAMRSTQIIAESMSHFKQSTDRARRA
jgi:serine phosphatase RsbU (regulator of sigma subunit)